MSAQLALVEKYLESARHLAGVRRQLVQIKETCDRWSKAHERIGRLARAAAAVLPFTRFPGLVHDQVDGLINSLQSQAGDWADKMYRAAFVQAPGYAGFDGSKGDGLNILASQGRHLVDAQHIMNASALRVYLIAFVFALWQQMWSRTGGIATVLLDDPQDLLDPGNVANLAATVPYLLDAGMCPLIVSNDFGFIPSIEDFVRAHGGSAAQKRTGVWEFSAISRSKSTASLAPVVDEVRERRDAWKDDPNNVSLARAFVHPVRVRIETKLWDLLACDPVLLKDPTLNDLLGKISGARTRGEKPFNEEPFRNLLGMPALHTGAAFRAAINKAHHGKADQITPAEAETVEKHFDEVFAAIDSCWLAFARFMGRLPPDNTAPVAAVAAANVIILPDRPIPVIGRLAARERGAALAAVENATEKFSLSELGPVGLFALRAPTLGLIAIPGQTLITLADAEIRNGDIAVVQTAKRTYARRIGIDRGDPSRIALETLPSSNPNVPPTHFIRRADARICKVIGVIFDNIAAPNSSDEAVMSAHSAVMEQVIAVANVIGDSAFPVAVNGGRVLLGQATEDLNLLEGRIIAVMTRTDEHSQDYLAYLKRLGKPMPGAPDVRYLENVGETGEGEYVRFASARRSKLEAVALVEKYWKVYGSLF